jgi:hypothetical protein
MTTPRDFVKHDPVSAALRVLLDVCRRMDSGNPDVRPSEDEYRAAIAMGYRALADATLAAKGDI